MPAPHRTLRLGSLEGTDLGDYLHTVHYFDEAFGQFVDRLRATGLLDESVVIVYGDHKGYLADERKLATLLGLSSSRPEDLWLERKRVPLVVRLPRGARAGPRSEAAGHLDVGPEVPGGVARGLLDADLPREVQDGRDALQLWGLAV